MRFFLSFFHAVIEESQEPAPSGPKEGSRHTPSVSRHRARMGAQSGGAPVSRLAPDEVTAHLQVSVPQVPGVSKVFGRTQTDDR